MAMISADEIKKLVLVTVSSEMALTERLVLKGGNLLDLVYDAAPRASVDLDFSMESEFSPLELGTLEGRIAGALMGVFGEEGYRVFDIELTERPRQVSQDMRSFWGGYRITFKVTDNKTFEDLAEDLQQLRVSAIDLGPGHRKSFRIDISKFEYCVPKKPTEVEGGTIFIYTPLMVVLEKLRAICQQMPEYRRIVKSHVGTARARDFVDICAVMERFRIDLQDNEAGELLHHIFGAKRVPLRLIGVIPDYREYHRPDFAGVVDTVRSDFPLRTFDHYFDYVIERCCRPLQPFWEEEPPRL